MLTILQGDVMDQLRTLPDESVQCCVTSPPYWGLRDYGTAQWEGGEDGCGHKMPATGGNPEQGANKGNNNFEAMPFKSKCGKCGARRIDSQIGLEKTPEEYVAKMVEVFREVRRVLRKDGTLWVNLGDSYAAQGGGGESRMIELYGEDSERCRGVHSAAGKGQQSGGRSLKIPAGLKPKDLCGIPWRVAFALQADGWWLRSDIIWAKPNPMPESVTDRPTKSHEYLFLLTKSSSYFYDAEAIKEPHARLWDGGKIGGSLSNGSERLSEAGRNDGGRERAFDPDPSGRNKRSVWTVATAPYPEAHFATYPPDLIKPCILAGTSAKGCCAKCGSPWERIVEKETNTHLRNLAGKNNDSYQRGRVTPRGSPVGDFHDLGTISSTTLGWQPTCKCQSETIPCTVLDPFAGSGTTGAVALELGRKAVLIELNPKYTELIKTRCNITPGMQLA